MATTVEIVNALLASGKYHTLLSLVKGFRNGVVYGCKVRFPHALVMTWLFKGGPISVQAKDIFMATYTHAKNLAQFVFMYKSFTAIMKELQGSRQQYHSFVSAFICGYIIFGNYNKVNEQINLYLLSRIVYGGVKLASSNGYLPQPKGDNFRWFSAVVWGIVLWMFTYHRKFLQPSLQNSMTYLYDDSEKWHNIKDFLIHNK